MCVWEGGGGNSESLDSPRSLCSECQRRSLVELSQQQSLFLAVDGLWKKDVVRDMKEKKHERRALLSCDGWPVSFEFLLRLAWRACGTRVSFPFLHATLWFW